PKKEEPTVEQELAALIEKTNALETFHLVYDMASSEDGESGSLELLYRAPDLGRAHLSSSEGDTDFWVQGKHMYVLADDRWRSARLGRACAPRLAHVHGGAVS